MSAIWITGLSMRRSSSFRSTIRRTRTPPRICTFTRQASTSTPDYANVATLNMPEVVTGGGLDDAVNYGVNQLVSERSRASIETK